MRRGELVYWFVTSLLLGWLLDPLAHGQVVWQSVTPTQCYGCCPPQSCQPRQLPYVSPQRPQPDGEYTQPAPQFQPLPSPPQPTTPALPTPEKPTAPGIDWDAYDKQQQEILAEQKKSTTELHSVLVAIQNQKGCDCQPTDLTPVLKAIEELKASAPQPVPPVPQPTHEQHVVIVADHNGDYWQRLATSIATAQKTYAGIQETTLPPFAIGPHPVAIVYRDSVPVRKVTGLYEVENLLARLARNEPI